MSIEDYELEGECGAEGVDRWHCGVEVQEQSWEITDIGSRNSQESARRNETNATSKR